MSDHVDMRCEQCRDILSAGLDNEDAPDERAGAEIHLSECGPCQRWLADATQVTRLARMGVVADSADLADTVLARTSLSGRWRRRVAGAVRVALGVVGCAQLLIGLAQMTLAPAAEHDHAAAASGAVPAAHLSHESAAWNIAIGAGFLWIAARRVRPAGLMLVLTAFVGVLGLLSLNDLVTGRVQTERLATHAFVVAGYLLSFALTGQRFDRGEPPAGQRTAPRWRVRLDPPAPASPARLRVVDRLALPPSARHDNAA